MTRAAIVLVSAATLAGAARPARACGGFFCNVQAPIDQAGEQILFAVEDGEVVAHVQIQYAGSPGDFAWVLPLPAEPTLETGTADLFAQLNARTLPSFTTRRDVWEECSEGRLLSGGPAAASAEDSGEGGAGGVKVTFRGAVGPYDAAVLTGDDAAEVRQWLDDNQYDIPDMAMPLIDTYVEQGDWFVALKLLSDRDTGDLVPIVVRFAWDAPCIPIRLTAIAAVEDMTIRTWILGDARAVPNNYQHVLLDLARIDWECGAANYTQVVTDAADEAGRQAFVTEYAGPSDVMAGALFEEGRFDAGDLSRAAGALAFLNQIVAQGFPLGNALRGVLAAHIPPPEGMDARAFIDEVLAQCWQDCFDPSGPCRGNTYCDFKAYADHLQTVPFDAEAAAAAVEAEVIAPLSAAQALIDAHPRMTVLFTTLSPEEMTLDPMFGFNPELPDVPRAHEAVVSRLCRDDRELFRLEVPDGRVVYIDGEDQQCAGPDPDAPVGTVARLRADLPGSEEGQELPEVGPAHTLYSNTARIDAILDAHNAEVTGDGCACALGRGPGGGAGAGLAALALAAAVASARRRYPPRAVAARRPRGRQ